MVTNKNNRLVVNTLITYGRLAITSMISLYSTRVILDALGARDFGLFNVVAGLAAMLSFLNTTMASSTQRFISFNLNLSTKKWNTIFANSIILHYAIAILVVIILETVGVYFVNYHLRIDADRLIVANYLFQTVVFSTFISIISVPYDAVINAHENFLFLAFVSLLETILKLLAAYYLLYTVLDKLLVYSCLLMAVSLLVRFIKRIYTSKRYSLNKINLRTNYDKHQVVGLLSFAGWNLIGILSYISRNQGIAVILNLFFGTVINAAYGIASQVNGQLMVVSSALVNAIQPQIVKSEGEGDRLRLIKLSIFSSKITFIIFAFIAIPVFIELPLILGLWVKQVPLYAVTFCRLILVLSLVLQFRSGITNAVHAIGAVKKYQLLNAPIQLLTLPISYILLYYGYDAYITIVVSILLEIVVLCLSIVFFCRLTGYKSIDFCKYVLIPCGVIVFVDYFAYTFLLAIGSGVAYRIFIFVDSSILYVLLCYFVGLRINEKVKLQEGIRKVFTILKCNR